VGALDAVLKALLPLSRVIDAATTWIGKRLAWLIVAAVVVSAVNATVRKIFDTSSNSWLELQWVLFSIVFLLCSPKQVRNIIDVIGHAFFLLPLCVVMILTGVPFFLVSYGQSEQSLNAGGLPQWPSKGLIMVAFAMLLIQGLSELVKRIAVMRDLIPDPHASQKSSIEAEAEEIISTIEKH